jgi:hypothetical protein
MVQRVLSSAHPSKEIIVTQPDSHLPADTTAKPADAAPTPAVENLEGKRDVKDADAERVKGGVKKTMSTQ